MSDRFLERGAVEFESLVAMLNNSRPDCSGVAHAVVPWSRSPLSYTRSEIPQLLFEARRVLLARAWHAVKGPAWAQPLPIGDEISPLLRATSGPLCLLGHYACSLMMMGYDYLGHASFHDYGCGVMAHPRVPEHIRADVELQAEFPAKELPGLCGRLIWFGEGLPAQVRVELLGR